MFLWWSYVSLIFYVPWILVLLSLHSKGLPLPAFTDSPSKIHLWILSLDHLCIFRVNLICYHSYMLLDFIYCKLLRVFAVTCMRIWSSFFVCFYNVCADFGIRMIKMLCISGPRSLHNSLLWFYSPFPQPIWDSLNFILYLLYWDQWQSLYELPFPIV